MLILSDSYTLKYINRYKRQDFNSLMEIDKVNRNFGCRVEFEQIRGIERAFQPGILDPNTFINVDALSSSLKELDYSGREKVQVYFKNVNLSLVDPKNRENWWDLFRQFESAIRDYGEAKYWYSDGEKVFFSGVFDDSVPPYQASIGLFSGAIKGFSCFVNLHNNKIDFSSDRNFEPKGDFVPGNVSFWEGSQDNLMNNALAINSAFRDMKHQGCINNQSFDGYHRQEIRIISDSGALVGSLYGQNSVTLLLKRKQLEKLVRI
jgi:hypothetical protein